MKATDLKIGDWVDYYGPVQIAELDMFLWSGWDKDHNFLTNIDYTDIKPIPITGEILKNNGFIEYKKDKYANGVFKLHYNLYLNLWEVFMLISSETDTNDKVYLTFIKYIHELQHLLWGLKKEEIIKL